MAIRPYKYTQNMPERLLTYFKSYFENKEGTKIEAVVKNGLPSFVKFAEENKLSSRTLKKWATEKDSAGKLKHPEFAEAYEECKAIVADVIDDGALVGSFSPTFAKYMLEGRYRDKTRETEQFEENGIDIEFYDREGEE